MMFRGHVRVGIATYFIAIVPIVAWILYRQNWSVAELGQYWWEILICFVLCVLGAMVPDIDIKSKSQRVIYAILIPVVLALILFRYYKEAAILSFFAILPNMLKHRGLLHSRPAAIILPVPLLVIPILVTGKLEYQQLGVSYYIAAVFGYMSHLIADRKERRR
jgi:membrane-bound metal-dependent hydrolase YbcI (DUF457 family)